MHICPSFFSFLKSVNTNQWPINDRQNLAIFCTKQLMVVYGFISFPFQGAYIESDNALCLKKGLARETRRNY